LDGQNREHSQRKTLHTKAQYSTQKCRRSHKTCETPTFSTKTVWSIIWRKKIRFFTEIQQASVILSASLEKANWF